MNKKTYKYSISQNFLQFQFESLGPKGKITKVVRYYPDNQEGITYFNLGFGDYDVKTGQVNDLSRSGNQDRDKILATIAMTVLEFTRHFPDALVYAEGSTPSRTRLYQIGIASYWTEIEKLLYVFGEHPVRGWEPFQLNTAYTAFLIKHK